MLSSRNPFENTIPVKAIVITAEDAEERRGIQNPGGSAVPVIAVD